VRRVTTDAGNAAKGDSHLLNSSDVLSNLRDLIVHLHRGNGTRAELIVTDVAECLKAIMLSGDDPQSFTMQRAQQTMFAIDEVRILLAQEEFEGAAIAARDAAREWKQQPSATA
jgi:hypothetical protein